MGYKLCKFREYCVRDTPLPGIYIPKFCKNFSKIFSFGVLYPYRCTDGGEIWLGGVDLWFTPPSQISHPLVQRVTHAWQKPQNRTLSNLCTGALRCVQRCQ